MSADAIIPALMLTGAVYCFYRAGQAGWRVIRYLWKTFFN